MELLHHLSLCSSHIPVSLCSLTHYNFRQFCFMYWLRRGSSKTTKSSRFASSQLYYSRERDIIFPYVKSQGRTLIGWFWIVNQLYARYYDWWGLVTCLTHNQKFERLWCTWFSSFPCIIFNVFAISRSYMCPSPNSSSGSLPVIQPLYFLIKLSIFGAMETKKLTRFLVVH